VEFLSREEWATELTGVTVTSVFTTSLSSFEKFPPVGGGAQSKSHQGTGTEKSGAGRRRAGLALRCSVFQGQPLAAVLVSFIIVVSRQ